MKVVYIAGKFTGPSAWEIGQSIRIAETWGLEVARLGASPLIPHANTRFFHGTLSTEFWYAATLALMAKCDAILLVPGWMDSRGAKAERDEAVRLGIPVFTGGAGFWDLRAWIRAEAEAAQ